MTKFGLNEKKMEGNYNKIFNKIRTFVTFDSINSNEANICLKNYLPPHYVTNIVNQNSW